MTRWRPSTSCLCELEFRDGPTQPPVHITRCAEHQDCTGADIWAENQGLNRTLGLLKQQGIAQEQVTWAFAPGCGRRRLTMTVRADYARLRLDPVDADAIVVTRA